MSYYHSYRPQQFSDLLGQDHVRTILVEAVKQNRLTHAYLFCGTRGTGKTSTARLLAKAINCVATKRTGSEPCNECALCQAITRGNCLDVIEIDAASNRGIDEIRQLQEQSRFQPQEGKQKIFIIDEVHMLTKEAFNALLKTLEEPPAHLTFILATTESHKLPATIISRCQRFDFFTPDTNTLTLYLERMAGQEGLKLAKEAAVRIAELAKGSFRDAATILEQLAGTHDKSISLATVTETLGLPDKGLVDRYLAALDTAGDTLLAPELSVYFGQGKSPVAFVDMAFQRLEQVLCRIDGQLVLSRPGAVFGTLVQIKSQMRFSPLPQLPVIVALSGVASAAPVTVTPIVSATSASPAASPTASTPSATANPVVTPASPVEGKKSAATEEVSDKSLPSTPEKTTAPVLAETVIITADALRSNADAPATEPMPSTEMVTIAVAEQVPPATLPSGEISDKWQKTLDQLLENSQSSLVSILRTAQPLSWDPPALRIGVQFTFHADQLAKQKNRDILEAAFQQTFGSPVRIDPEVVAMTDLAAEAEEIF